MFTKIFWQIKQNYTKTNTLFNSKAYCGCLQGTLIFEFHFYYKSVTESSPSLTCL